eukprot:1159086-Pelagomonas_calceolata.AAC.10
MSKLVRLQEGYAKPGTQQEGYAKRGAKQAAAIKESAMKIATLEGSLGQVRLLEAPLPYRLQDALKQVSLVWAAVPERQREWPRFWVRDSNASKNLDQGAAEVVKNEELRSLDQGATEAIVTGKGALLKNLD